MDILDYRQLKKDKLITLKEIGGVPFWVRKTFSPKTGKPAEPEQEVISAQVISQARTAIAQDLEQVNSQRLNLRQELQQLKKHEKDLNQAVKEVDALEVDFNAAFPDTEE